ncbi:hypothetical protein D3C78_1207590 [compost metagenome]
MEIVIGQSRLNACFRSQGHIGLAHADTGGKSSIFGQFETAMGKLRHFRRAFVERHLGLFEPRRNCHAGSSRTRAEIGDPAGAIVRHQ